MRTVRPIEPIRPVRGVRRIALRYVPSIKQLRMWLAFARQKAKDMPKDRPKDGPAPPQLSEQPAADPSEVSADWESAAETDLAADHGHIDKRV